MQYDIFVPDRSPQRDKGLESILDIQYARAITFRSEKLAVLLSQYGIF